MTLPPVGRIGNPSHARMTLPSVGRIANPSHASMTLPPVGRIGNPSHASMTLPSVGRIGNPSHASMTLPPVGRIGNPSSAGMTLPPVGRIRQSVPQRWRPTLPNDDAVCHLPLAWPIRATGNQLFQIAAAIGTAKNRRDFVFPPWEYASYFRRPIPQSPDIRCSLDSRIERGCATHCPPTCSWQPPWLPCKTAPIAVHDWASLERFLLSRSMPAKAGTPAITGPQKIAGMSRRYTPDARPSCLGIRR